MRKLNVLGLLIIVAIFIVSCKPEMEKKTTIVDFEDVSLDENGITNETFISNGITFVKNGVNSWDGGFTATNITDTTHTGYVPVFDYSCIAAKGANNSKTYATGFVSFYESRLDTIKCPADVNGNFSAKSVMITNATWPYKGMKTGNYGDFSTARKFTEGDWFKVTITGFLNKVKTGEVDYFLADFRNGKSFISNEWTKTDISLLGEVDMIVFTLSSSDNDDEYGMNTPAYFCIDNLVLSQDIENK